MKKTIFLIITVIVVCVLGVTLSGCNNSTPTQKLLSNSRAWISANTDETLVYDAVYKDKTDEQVNGTLTVNVKSYNKETITLNDGWKKDNATGYVATTTLEMENGDTKVSQVYFTTAIEVKYAYEQKNFGGKVSGYSAEYKDEKCHYTYYEGEGDNKNESKGEIKVGSFAESPYVDNAMLYQIVRCLPESASSFTFDVPDVTLGDLQSVTVTPATTSVSTIKDGSGKEYLCYFTSITLNRTFPGSGESLTCAISSTPYPSAEDPQIRNLIVQIKEGDTIYTLKSASYAGQTQTE